MKSRDSCERFSWTSWTGPEIDFLLLPLSGTEEEVLPLAFPLSFPPSLPLSFPLSFPLFFPLPLLFPLSRGWRIGFGRERLRLLVSLSRGRSSLILCLGRPRCCSAASASASPATIADSASIP